MWYFCRTLGLSCLMLMSMAACQNNPTQDNPQQNAPQRYSAATFMHCSAGFDADIAARLQAELKQHNGQVTPAYGDFARGVIDSQTQIPASERQVMYSDYINCVMVSANTGAPGEAPDTAACLNKCDISNDACESRVTGLFNACIRQAMDACYVGCKKDNPADDCYARICAWHEMTPDDRAPYAQGCQADKAYASRASQCATNDADCRQACRKP